VVEKKADRRVRFFGFGEKCEACTLVKYIGKEFEPKAQRWSVRVTGLIWREKFRTTI